MFRLYKLLNHWNTWRFYFWVFLIFLILLFLLIQRKIVNANINRSVLFILMGTLLVLLQSQVFLIVVCWLHTVVVNWGRVSLNHHLAFQPVFFIVIKSNDLWKMCIRWTWSVRRCNRRSEITGVSALLWVAIVLVVLAVSSPVVLRNRLLRRHLKCCLQVLVLARGAMQLVCLLINWVLARHARSATT